ncbi:NCS1 family nucleobase:cation symporter [Neobacillus novalis]|uniref:NCS1 family nucleobase:cation symporter n=1 Tax=Neobacillus novalis TaxID=220687 RepID=A0AA95MJR8_9BACI|nr:NCS1 family nucleobase:cation symporter [Neobacillus novalis]WHY85162.1 NCS1 family nucleobase:cation symporter [Neobacillus novalis]
MGQNNPASNQEVSFSKDLMPTGQEDRKWKVGNYFSLWMGAVHNVPSYLTIGGFFALGLSIGQVFWTIMIAAVILGVILVLGGHAGAKFGVPTSMLLRTSFGQRGAMVPGIIRGVIAAIMWFGFQTYAGSLAVTILIGEFWPAFLNLGGGWNFFGLHLPGLISFLLFWSINILFVYGGMGVLGKFTNILSPIIYIVFGGMAIWAVKLAGGITPILHYTAKGIEGNSVLVFIACVSALLATWASLAVSVSDFTREARSQKDQTIGQIAGVILTYLLFAFASIAVIVGSEIAFGTPIWNVLDVVDKFDSKFAIAVSVITICLTTLSVNITGNIIPAGYQLATLFPKKLTFKTGAFIAAVAGILIMPWKLMENPTSIFTFLGVMGGLLSPVLGIMLAHYFVIAKKEINMKDLYSANGMYKYRNGFNIPALVTTAIAGVISLIGQFVPVFKPLYDMSFFTGTITAFILYILFVKKGMSTINITGHSEDGLKEIS